VAHGSSLGNLKAPIRRQRPGKDDGEIVYEGLEEAVGDLSLRAYPPLFLPPRPVDPKSGKPILSRVRIEACRVCVQPTFLRKVREALGPGMDAVTGPRFMTAADQSKISLDSLMWLLNEFTLLRPHKLDRASLIEAFRKGDLTFAPGLPHFYDGSAVPNSS